MLFIVRGRGMSTVTMLFDQSRPGAHHRDAIAKHDRFFDVMGDENHGFLVALPDAQKLLAHDETGLRVEVGERLVHQHHLGIVGQRPRDGNLLFHAARKFVRPSAGEIQQPHHFEKKAADAFINRRLFLAKLRAQRHVFFDRAPGHQRRLLKHHRNGRLRMLLADELHGAGGRGFQAADDVQQRRLAAARRTDDAEELAVAHIEIDAADSANVALARRVYFGQSANDDLHVNNDRNLLFRARRRDVKTRLHQPRASHYQQLNSESDKGTQSVHFEDYLMRRVVSTYGATLCSGGGPFLFESIF